MQADKSIVQVFLLAWLPISVMLIARYGARRGGLAAAGLGTMFLPAANVEFGINFTRSLSVGYGLLLGLVLMQWSVLSSFRPQLADLPITGWIVVPLITSLTNGLGLYDGISGMFYRSVAWGVPYLFGRLYFTRHRHHRDLTIAMVLGGLIYAPLCLWEIRMSPNLHYHVFGYLQHTFVQTIRGSFYRPMVFMDHGLMVGMWMALSTTTAYVLWRTKAVVRIGGVEMKGLCVVLFCTTVACQSMGASILTIVGIAATESMLRLRWRLPLIALVLFPFVHIALQVQGSTANRVLVSIVEPISHRRASSLAYRLNAEQLAVRAVDQRLFFGWGGYDRGALQEEADGKSVARDGLWIIALSGNGYVGLLAFLFMLALPPLRLLRRLPPKWWRDPSATPTLATAMLIAIFGVDALFNAFGTPVYSIAIGALTSLPALREVYVPREALALRQRSRMAVTRAGG